MAAKTAKKSATAKKAAAKRAASKAAKPRTAAAKSSKRKSAKAAAKPPARRAPSKTANQQKTAPASELIDARVQELRDWRGAMLARLRSLIRDVDPEVIEEWKWRGVPVWSLDGMICTGETYKGVVKLTFFRGAQLDDPAKLFNSSLEGNARRAIDFREGDAVDEDAFRALIRAAFALNRSVTASRTRKN
jgi:hypothetical protein